MRQVSVWQEAFYAAPYTVKALALTPLVVFIPSFYAVDYGIPLALVGTILFASRLVDILTDPLIGIASDSIRSRFGRRKPFIAAGTPILMISCWMVFAPPVEVTPLYATVWLVAIYFGFTLLDIPYRAWGADLVTGYDGRTRISGWREAANIVSGLLAQCVILVAPVVGLGSTSETLRLMAIGFVCLLPPLLALSMWRIPEPPIEELVQERMTLGRSLRAIWNNKPFLWLLAGMAVLMSGAIIGASLHLIVMESYFGIRHLFPIILASENVASLIAVPFWVWLSKRIGKNNALALAAFLMGVFSAPIPLLDQDQGVLYGVVIVVRGLMLGALGILIGSMIADVTDVDLQATGRSRSGLFFAFTGLVTKLGIALGALAGLVLPPLFGFDPGSEDNSSVAMNALIMTYAWVPMIIMASSAYFFWRYPLSRQNQEKLRADIEASSTATATPERSL